MTGNTNIKYEFETNDSFLAFIFPVIFLPIYYDTEINVLFKVLIYITPAWLLSTLTYNKIDISGDNVYYTKYTRPFAKKYNIPFSDIEKVYISLSEMTNKTRPSISIYSKSLKKKFSMRITRGIEENLCEYFIDNKIDVETNNYSLKNHISHYILGHRPKSN